VRGVSQNDFAVNGSSSQSRTREHTLLLQHPPRLFSSVRRGQGETGEEEKSEHRTVCSGTKLYTRNGAVPEKQAGGAALTEVDVKVLGLRLCGYEG